MTHFPSRVTADRMSMFRRSMPVKTIAALFVDKKYPARVTGMRATFAYHAHAFACPAWDHAPQFFTGSRLSPCPLNPSVSSTPSSSAR